MKTTRTLIAVAISTFTILFTSCETKQEQPTQVSRDQVYHTVLSSVRLQDGVPLNIDVSVRWKISDLNTFATQFESTDKYDSLILAPRELELANDVSNTFVNVDTVFNTQRHEFISELKEYLLANLGEPGVEIKEVIISDVIFPFNYTSGKEKLALQEQELIRIKKQTEIEQSRAVAAKKNAEAQGKVTMAQAEVDAKVQKIKAETEKSVRMSRLAKAETEKQVSVMNAEAEAKRRVLLAKAELENKQDLKNLKMQEKRDVNKIELENKQAVELVAFEQELKMAQLCSENPVYATYMVNKELASKVQIAVLPNNQDGSVFNSLLNNNTAQK